MFRIFFLFFGCFLMAACSSKVGEDVAEQVGKIAIKGIEESMDSMEESLSKPKVACPVISKISKKKLVTKKAGRVDLSDFGFTVSMKVPKRTTVGTVPRLLDNSPPKVRLHHRCDTDGIYLLQEHPKAFHVFLETASEAADHKREALLKDLAEASSLLDTQIKRVHDKQTENGWEMVYLATDDETRDEYVVTTWNQKLGLKCSGMMIWSKKQTDTALKICRSLQAVASK